MMTREVPCTHEGIARLGLKSKRLVDVSASTSLFLDSSWSEGSRTLTTILNLETLAEIHVPRTSWPNPPTSYTLKPGEVAIQSGTWRGKPSRLCVRMHPDDFARLMVDRCIAHEDCRACPELAEACIAKAGPSPRTVKILSTFRAYRAACRREYLDRIGMTSEELEGLVSAGFISRNKAGALALTDNGRMLATDRNV